jgi:hypothetical protein
MIRKLGLALTTALVCTYSTGASAAELAVTDASTTEAAVEASDSATYGVAAEVDNSAADSIAASSLAAAESASTSGGGWEVSFTPYLWMSGMKIDIETPQGETVEVHDSFTDILGDLKFAFMGAMELKHGRFVSVQDIIFISMGSSADGHIGPVPIEAEVDERLISTTHLFGYRVVDEGPMFVDLFAGARFSSIKVDVELNLPQLTVERDTKKTEIGPVIASRVRFPLSDKWGIAVYGDLGGFGVGADLSWQLLGTVQYEISDRWRLAAGWRHFSATQEKNDFDVDIKLDGPILGVTYRF